MRGELELNLRFRSLLISDTDWLTETVNDPEAAKYSLSVYPKTQHEVEEFVKKDLENNEAKNVVAELDGEPAGCVSVWGRTSGRDRHVAWLAIFVRRKCWGKSVGSALMEEAIRIAKDSGFRRLVLGVFEGNERAIRLYRKFGFKNEGYEKDEVYIDGSWRKSFIMDLEIAPCKPRLKITPSAHATKQSLGRSLGIQVRQLENRDLEALNKLHNCRESTKSSYRIPPTTREETKRWYEGIKSQEEKYCLACFKNSKLLGYLQFRTYRLPFPCLKFEEAIVDMSQEPCEAAESLVEAIKGFRERYWYRSIFAYVPETSVSVTDALEHQGFKRTGAMKNYYFIDGYYVDAPVYGYP
jgi:RimJ/RimL family protein N-acetyltransferase